MDKETLVRELELEPHVEGGYYRRVYESGVRLPGGARTASSIYYLLGTEDRSRLHCVGRDELWCFHGGRSLELYLVEGGTVAIRRLGMDAARGEVPFLAVPGDAVFGALPAAGDGPDYALVSCIVTPEFTGEGYRLLSPGEAAELARTCPLPERFLG